MGRFDVIQTQDQPASARPEESPVNADHFLEKAREAMRKGRWEAALKAYGRALERDRDCEEAWAGQVHALVEMGQHGEAFTWTEQAAKVAGETPRILALRALCCARQGRLDDALQWSDRAMKASLDDWEVWIARAEVLFAAGHDEPASRALDKAYERTPAPETRRRCGAVALHYGNLRVAQRWLERAKRESPDDPLVALALGVLRERQDDLVAARVELDRALALEPELKAARLALDDIDSRSKVERAISKIKRWFDG